MKAKKTPLKKGLKKYYRWARQSWRRSYVRVLEILEQELGYEIQAC